MCWELELWGKNRAALAAAASRSSPAAPGLAQAFAPVAICQRGRELCRTQPPARQPRYSCQSSTNSANRQPVHQRFDNGLETRGGLHNADARTPWPGELLALDEHRAATQPPGRAAGRGADRALSLAATLKLDRAFGLPRELSADLLGRRPDVVAARLRAQALGGRIAQAEFYPGDLSALVGVQSLGLNMLAKGWL